MNPTKEDKIKCWLVIISHLLMMCWSAITAPFIYPIWYIYRKQITKKVYTGTSWQEIIDLIRANKPEIAKQKLVSNGRFYYWLWTYGELNDPAGEGDMPLKFGKKTFWNRFRFCALRNPRFNINSIEYRTGKIVETVIIKDTRNFSVWYVSMGISDSPDGIYYAWMKDDKGKWYFVYENNNAKRIFYFGYIGFSTSEGGRFETSRRVPDKTYTK